MQGVCNNCGNAGQAIVPHPAHVQDGLWKPYRKNSVGKPVFATVAVTCVCAKGRRMHADMVENGRKPLSLEKYREEVYHDPQELIDEVYPPAPPSTVKVGELGKKLAEAWAVPG